MAVRIEVTEHIVGRSWLYEGKKRTGRKRLVPTYRLVLSVDQTDSSCPDQFFAVTRDTSPVIFGDTVRHYGTNGECPPSRISSPYLAVWHQHGSLQDALRLCEPRFGPVTIQGVGNVLRHGVLIHHGPARSEGCMLISGGQKGWRQFLAAVRHFETVTADPSMYVYVQPRHFGNDNPLSCA
ncbi:MAG: hypothetical protein RLZZ70_650 [Candidatus Parcubacteria bacterium]|jgi:hypothetical protein